MFFSTLLVAAATLANVVSAQELPPSIQPCCDIDPGSVNSTLRNSWCLAQRNTCPEVCGGFAGINNTCDVTTLEFTCVCGDGTTPNISDYQQTVPGQMCRAWFEECIVASGTDLQQQQACKAVQCGNRTSARQTSSAAPSTTPSPTGGESDNPASATAPAPSSSGAATALAIARSYGTPLLAGGMAALFGLAL